MSDHCNIPHPLKREGTYQWQRMPEGLTEGYFKPDDRSLEQLVRQVARYAEYIRYYDSNLNEWGRWEVFFEYLYDYDNQKLKIDNIDSLLDTGEVPPHLGLLLSFLKTFQLVRDEYNSFSERHLAFYYNDVLQLSPKDAVPDSVAVLFEPEKNATQVKVEEGRELNAGKDDTGVALVYKTAREIVVNQASITRKKTIYADSITDGVKGSPAALYISADAATDNKFVQNNVTSWYPFGNSNNSKADIGFAISSPMLFAKEGRRRFSIKVEGGAHLPRTSFTAWYTGPKGWVEAEVDLVPGEDGENNTTAKAYLLIKIDEALPEIAAYSEKVHKAGYPCTYPVLKLLLKNDENFAEACEVMTGLKFSDFKKLVMNVEGAKSFTVMGENGKLSPLQAFKPFGNNPVKNKSFFTIGSSHAFNKYLRTFHLAINWKGAPGNMGKYYTAYSSYIKDVVQKGQDPSIGPQTSAGFASQWKKFDQGNVPGKVELLSGGKWREVKEDENAHYHFHAHKVKKAHSYNTFHAENLITDTYDADNSNDYSESSRWGFAKVTLEYNFGHQFYPSVLSYNVVHNSGNPLPPQPYTPEFASLHLDYVQQDGVDIVNKPEHTFLQIHPFGYVVVDTPDTPVIDPDYNNNGQLFIGIANCTAAQTINLYIARLDGTEDINAEVGENIDWYYLEGNQWVKFRFEEITVDTTHNFTASGFLSFAIPEAALASNTLMGENLLWIRAVSATSYNAFPSIIDIHTNATEAVFDDRGNDPYHLETALAAEKISKPLIKIDGIKKASQPYASYDGAMAEQTEHFNIRISERLRHKNRAWSSWDFEHLVLENFPAIYKLKCISHASSGCMYVPGNVLCVALPSVVNLAEKDQLQPRISKAVLTEAAEFAAQWMSTFAKVEFINPVYEPITVKCSVKIRTGYDENYYATQLNTDIQEYLAPWIQNTGLSPSFGGTIYASAIINFIEERPYIDYITSFGAYKEENGVLISWDESVTGSSEDVILTSAAQHQIDTNAVC